MHMNSAAQPQCFVDVIIILIISSPRSRLSLWKGDWRATGLLGPPGRRWALRAGVGGLSADNTVA